MKRLLNFYREHFHISMTKEQEKGYIEGCAKHILRYESKILFLIMAFQVYNIVYALVYTHGRLHTVSSRVYTVLYVTALLVSMGFFFLSAYLKKNFPNTAQTVMVVQFLYAIFLLLWGASITVYDQRVSDNISVYLIISLTVAMLIYFTPIQAILTYGSLQILLACLLPALKDPAKDCYGEIVNLTVMTFMCIIISIYRYCGNRRQYLYQQEIIEKNFQLDYMANRDSLTGLRNRRFLENEIDSLYRKCWDDGLPVTFMMLDIDSFKDYNDRFGHLQGDECLRRLAWRMNRALAKEHEYLLRYGGEEFLYVGIGVDFAAAKSKGVYFNQIIRELVIGPSDAEPMGITVSIGTYTASRETGEDYPNWEECVSRADKALYMAKTSGKDKCVCLP